MRVTISLAYFDIGVRGGQNHLEGVSATVERPIMAGGYEPVAFDSTTEFSNSFTLNVDVDAADCGLIWRLSIDEPLDNPTGPLLEDAFVQLDAAIDAYFGLTDDPSYFMTVVP